MPVLLPEGLTIVPFAGDEALGAQARTFCLQVIKDTYGYDYTPAWHEDLDSLTQPHGHYDVAQRSRFFIVQNAAGEVLGTAGLRGLWWKPNMVELLKEIYPHPQTVGSLWRMYLHPSIRKQGVGNALIQLCHNAAKAHGYQHMYLHCETKANRLRQYYQTYGYNCILEEPDTA
ncbi:MAG: GNAT family N-acetyltransferase, partial [Alphaproteobacteria bacterium]